MFTIDFFSSRVSIFIFKKCSAYTHVFADTIRSIALLVASVLEQFIPQVTPEEADASAAIAVSIIILIAMLPLFSGLRCTCGELLAIRREEASEIILNAMKEKEYKSNGHDDGCGGRVTGEGGGHDEGDEYLFV